MTSTLFDPSRSQDKALSGCVEEGAFLLGECCGHDVFGCFMPFSTLNSLALAPFEFPSSLQPWTPCPRAGFYKTSLILESQGTANVFLCLMFLMSSEYHLLFCKKLHNIKVILLKCSTCRNRSYVIPWRESTHSSQWLLNIEAMRGAVCSVAL